MISLRLVVGQGVRSVCRYSLVNTASLISFVVGGRCNQRALGYLVGEGEAAHVEAIYFYCASKCGPVVFLSGSAHFVSAGWSKRSVGWCKVLRGQYLVVPGPRGLRRLSECRCLLSAEGVRVSFVYGLGLLA